MKIEIGINKSQIITDNPNLIKTLDKLYSFNVEGAYYSQRYNKGWDGKKHFITLNGKFSTGLLDRIINDLKEAGLKDIELVYKYTADNNDYLPVKSVKSFEYRDEQLKLIETAIKSKRCIIKASTGFGKTLVLAGLIKTLYTPGRKMVVVCNQKQILTQTYDFLKKVGISNLGICFGQGFIYDDIMCCTSKSLDKILDHIEESECLFVDEIHEFCKGSMSKDIINSFPKAQFRIGFTATPPKKEIYLYELEGALGPTVEIISTQELIEQGSLVKPIIQFIKINDPSLLNDGSYQEIYEQNVINSEYRNNVIKSVHESIYNNNEQAKVLVLVQNIAHGRILESLLPNSQFLEGATDLSERYAIIDKFVKSKENRTIIGTKILQTGISINEVTHFINARALSSDIATIQALGRALRTHETKKQVYVYDFWDESIYLKKHSKQRKKHYESEGHEVKII